LIFSNDLINYLLFIFRLSNGLKVLMNIKVWIII